LFISQRLIKGHPDKSSISSPIIKIAVSAIAIGIVMMLIAIGTGLGLQHNIRQKVAAFNGHIQLLNFDQNNSNVSLYPIDKQQKFLTENSIEGIEHTQAVILKAGVIRTKETFEGIIAKGVGSDFNWSLFKDMIVQGSIPDFKGTLNEEIVISKTLANSLELKLGDQCNAFFLKEESSGSLPNQRRFTISGIYDSGFEEFDSSYIFVDIRHLQRINRWDENQVGLIEVFIDDFKQLDLYADSIYKQSSSQLDVRTLRDRYYTIFEWIDLFDFNIALIIGIMILVGGINIVTALLVLVLEKTNTIGVLKALGASNWTIRKIFIYQAIYLVLRGLFWGNLIGLSLLAIQYYYRLIRFPNPKEYYMAYIPVSISAIDIALLNIGVVIISLAMLLIPSYVVSKISPIKSIKFD